MNDTEQSSRDAEFSGEQSGFGFFGGHIFGDAAPVPISVDGKICGVPGICSIQAKNNCFHVPLQTCEECSSASLGLFIFFVSCLGLAILLGNLLVIKVYYFQYRNKKLSKFDNFRLSLAVADLLTGNLSQFWWYS